MPYVIRTQRFYAGRFSETLRYGLNELVSTVGGEFAFDGDMPAEVLTGE